MMKVIFSSRFRRRIKKFTAPVHARARKQLKLLRKDFHHPSLRVKKYNESDGIWQARIDRSHRFYFLVKKGVYILLDITKHKK